MAVVGVSTSSPDAFGGGSGGRLTTCAKSLELGEISRSPVCDRAIESVWRLVAEGLVLPREVVEVEVTLDAGARLVQVAGVVLTAKVGHVHAHVLLECQE